MKKYIVFCSLFLWVFSLHAEDSWTNFIKKVDRVAKFEEIHLDNEYLQRYRGSLGKWVRRRGSISGYASKYQTTIHEIKNINGITSNFKYYRKHYLFIPFSDVYIKRLSQMGIRRMKTKIRSGEFLWPVKGSRISSRVGRRWGKDHTGLDIATPRGTMVLAAKGGEVVKVGHNGAFGLTVVVAHGDGYRTQYSHLSEILIERGDVIKKGQIVALTGNTGRSTGPHLHFEVRCIGIILNPESFLPAFSEARSRLAKFDVELDKKHINQGF